jgi:hypothetical protein
MSAVRLKHLGFIPLLLLWFPVLVQGEELGIPPDTDFEKIFNKPAIIKTTVSGEEGDDHTRWIGMLADIHMCTDIPQDVLRRVATDYEHYPGVFKRLTSIRVNRAPEGVYQDWHISVGFNNFSVDTDYTLLAVEQINTREKYLLDFTHVSDDGSIKDAWGAWYFEDIMVDGKACTYVRYITSCKTLRKFLLQRMVLGIIINKEYTDMMNQFLQSAKTMQTALQQVF